MKTSARSTIRALALTVAALAAAGLAQAKSVPGDGAQPIVELMVTITKHEGELNLTPDQLKALDDWKKTAMPIRMGIQKRILDARDQLRQAILENKPAAEREVLMKQALDAEREHFQARDRCVEQMRKVLRPDQFAQVVRLYLDELR